MRVGIVGAGMAGLGAARKLVSHGHEAVVFEIDDRVGGRVATERIGPYTFDTGAPDLAPGDSNLGDAMLGELKSDELLVIDKPIHTHTALRVIPAEAAKPRLLRYTYVSGNARLAEMLSKGLDIRLGTGVGALERGGSSGFVAAGEEFDALILTPPVPQTEALMATIGEHRPLANTSYRPGISVMLGYELELPEVPYHALVDLEQRHPLTWLSVESVKCRERAPEGHTAFVAQLGPQFSASRLGAEEEKIVASTVGYICRLYGPEWSSPAVWAVRRWRFAQPETYAMFETVNHASARLLVAGDGVLGARVEFAYEAGLRAAKLLLAQDEQS